MRSIALAISAAALTVMTAIGMAQAAPIAPLPGAVQAETGKVTPVYYYRYHRHCWRGRYGYVHCR